MKNDFVEVSAFSKTPYRNRVSSLLMPITLLVFIAVFLDSKLTGFFSLVLTILFFIALVLIVKNWTVAKLEFNRSPFKRLKQFIVVNKLYDEETREVGKDKQRKKVIVNSACFEFLVTDTELIIRALKNGDKYTDKANTYDSMLGALFGLVVSNKVDNVNYCDYVFNTKADERLIVRENDLEYNESTIIPLNNNIGWDIQKFPHALIAGATGGGKTTFINYLIIEILKMRGELLIADPKHSDLFSLHFYLGKDRVAGEPNQIARVVKKAKEIMDARFKEYKGDSSSYGKNYRDFDDLPPVFLIVDELGALRMGADKKVFAEIMSQLQEVILKGREMGVFVILATQQPNAQNIPTEVRDNLSLRVSLGNLSQEGLRMTFGGIDGDLPTVEGKGSGYIFLDGMRWNNPKSFQAPFLDYEKFNFVVELQKYANITNY